MGASQDSGVEQVLCYCVTFENRDERGSKMASDVGGKKIAAGILGILLGALGIHKFILGLTTPGIIMLLVSILSLGLLSPIMGIIGLVEGIIYLTKSDEDFERTYIQGKKGWF